MTDRLATFSTHNSTLRDMTSAQFEYAKTIRQLTSGRKASTFDELSGVIERVSANQSKLSRVDNYTKNNTAVVSALRTADQSLNQIQKEISGFQSTLTLRKGATNGEQMNFQILAQKALDVISGALNASSGGRYIFGGTKTDVRPIADVVSITTSGVPDDSYYQGNSEILGTRISDTRTVNYGVTANEEAFQKAFAAILTAKHEDAASEGGTKPDFTKAFDLLNEAITGLSNVRAGINTSIVDIEQSNDEMNTLKVYWQQAVSEDTDTDIAEASIRMQTQKDILQASYQTYALASKLKLSDYLN